MVVVVVVVVVVGGGEGWVSAVEPSCRKRREVQFPVHHRRQRDTEQETARYQRDTCPTPKAARSGSAQPTPDAALLSTFALSKRHLQGHHCGSKRQRERFQPAPIDAVKGPPMPKRQLQLAVTKSILLDDEIAARLHRHPGV